ncbi:MAG: winged helix-turn-helix domain-containing protein [Nocardioidaceae bacterium]
MRTTERLTLTQARRIALAAQGFTARRPTVADARALNRVADRLGLFQIDSVNVFTRAHYMPLYSRIGPYAPSLLERSFQRAPRRMFEYWGHEASLVRVDLQPALRFRMASLDGAWGGVKRAAAEHPDVVEWVLDEVTRRGPLTARQIDTDVHRERTDWGWNWSLVKTVLEALFYTGRITSAGRNSAFERLYDLPERVLPAAVVNAPTPDVEESHRILVRQSAQAHGVGTEQCLRDYFRLKPAATRQAVADLVDAGELVPVAVQGWKRPAYLHHEAALPRTVRARALLSPFDPLVFERTRTEVLFDFKYRIEIYVPEHLRVHGYYVLPFLLGDRLVARVDLKADRQRRALLVRAAHVEPGAPASTASELAEELTQVADWLGLDDVVVAPRGDLAPDLAAAVAGAGAGGPEPERAATRITPGQAGPVNLTSSRSA